MKRLWWTIGGLLAAVVLLAAGFWIGRYTAPTIADEDTTMADEDTTIPSDTTTFYATVQEINGTQLLVQGLDVNDINYRGEFWLSTDENTAFSWRGTAMTVSDLAVGDRVSVTFSGEVQETYPAGITQVVRILLLEDEGPA